TNNYLAARKKHFSILLWQYIASIGFKTITIAGLLIVGSFLVMNNQINIGQFVAAEIVVLLVVNSVEKLILSMETIYDVLTAVEKLGNVTDLTLEETDGIAFEQIDTGQGMSLQVRNLVYRFAPAEAPVINQLNFDVEAQERICISGYNSSGKSTLSQILASLFTSFEGSITYNGIPAKNLNIAELRAYIGDYCSHEDIFRGTLEENITMGNPNINTKQLIEAIEVVGLTQFVQQLKDGFGTQIIPEGKTLPRSVVKKIILARSIISQPRLFVMEDPTAGLEAAEQERILQYLTHPTRRWTLIIVSNNPHVAVLCNRIIVMKQGQIIDAGSFENILQKPYYNDIFNS
ncbi:xenobiotic-transporting ATPase, partial [Sphingobacteriales bacterium UPWRP_1]